MNKRNITPLILSTILIGLICIFSILRLNNLSIWQDATINFDIVISVIYVVWMIFESKISKKELSKGNKTSDFGTCELYAIGQAGVFLSALWFNSVWKDPNIFHFFGLLIFISGIIYRIWAIMTLGRYYSHIVREVEGHKIIDSGPYCYIRHPAYTGMILANTGIVLFFFNAVTLLIFLLVLIPAIALRILIEEKTLFNIEGYSEFAKSRKRLIPAIW
ncbi:MAG TPA: isoprenylcysteine carboxylmethyltransferase family protein [Bacteroidetes bacterium]|nr:isoprenylcysteine carboxylmethyltransferase family protein [Bacteroidota bacterium]